VERLPRKQAIRCVRRSLVQIKPPQLRLGEQACNNKDTGADAFLNWLTWPFLAAAQSAESWMNAGNKALLIGNPLKKSGQLLTLAWSQRCAK
jgi:hypothetical protein